MYGVFVPTFTIKNQANVGKYISYMDPMGRIHVSDQIIATSRDQKPQFWTNFGSFLVSGNGTPAILGKFYAGEIIV